MVLIRDHSDLFLRIPGSGRRYFRPDSLSRGQGGSEVHAHRWPGRAPGSSQATGETEAHGGGQGRAGTHHVHDLQKAQGEVDGERLRVVDHGPLQGVVVLDQVLVELPLELALQGHFRRGEESRAGCSGKARGHAPCAPCPHPRPPKRRSPDAQGSPSPRTADCDPRRPRRERTPKPGPGAGRPKPPGMRPGSRGRRVERGETSGFTVQERRGQRQAQ